MEVIKVSEKQCMDTCNSQKACRAIEYRTHEKRAWDHYFKSKSTNNLYN